MEPSSAPATGIAASASASIALRPLLEGPRQSARVLGSFSTAVYVESVRGDVLAIVTRDATQLPNALVLPASSATDPFRQIHAHSSAAVGAGRVELGGMTVRVGRWRSSVMALPSAAPAPDPRACDRLLAVLDAGPLRLPPGVRRGANVVSSRLAAGRVVTAAAASIRIVGLGPGLTPAGDDVLAGMLISLHRLGAPAVGISFGGRVAALARARTTALSASLLRHAANGEALPQAAALADALGGYGNVAEAATALLMVGHSSGHDLARGLHLGARAALANVDRWRNSA